MELQRAAHVVLIINRFIQYFLLCKQYFHNVYGYRCPFRSEPTPPLWWGLRPAVCSATEVAGLNSHQVHTRDFFGLVRTKQYLCEYTLSHLKVERSLQGFAYKVFAPVMMIIITTKKLCLLFLKNMLNCPTFFFFPVFFLTHKGFHQGLCKVGRHEMRLAQPRGGLAVPLKEMKLLNAHASGALKDCFFLFLQNKKVIKRNYLKCSGIFISRKPSAQKLARQKYLFFSIFTFLFVCLFWLQ